MTSAYANSGDHMRQEVAIPRHRSQGDSAPGTCTAIYMRVASPGRFETDISIADRRHMLRLVALHPAQDFDA